MKRLAVIVLTIVMCLSASFCSYAIPQMRLYAAPQAGQSIPVPGKVVTRSDHITQQQFEQILSTLRAMKDNFADGNYDFCHTGVQCTSEAEAKALIQGFKELFLTDNRFILYYNDRGYNRIYVNPKTDDQGRYSYWLCGNGGPCGIYAVWKPDADANEMLRQHDAAKCVIDSLLADAPADLYEKIKYYNDVLAARITYDLDGYYSGSAKHSPYHGLVEGSSVCTGYAESFFNLCYYSGIPCAVSDCVSEYSVNGLSDHKISMVNVDGCWKEVDVTWNDSANGVRYDYFMVELDDTWQHHINGIEK